MATYLGAESFHTQSSDGTISITRHADAEGILVLVTGYSGSTTVFLDVLNFDNGGTFDFTRIDDQRYSGSFTGISASAYIITDDSADFPSSGAGTLYYENAGSYAEGILVAVIYVSDIDVTDPVRDFENRDSTEGTNNTFTSAMSGVVAGDLSFIFGYTFGSAANVTPSGLGQTEINTGTAFNSAAIAVAYESGEDAMQITGDYLVPFAIALKDSGGAPPVTAKGFRLLRNRMLANVMLGRGNLR